MWKSNNIEALLCEAERCAAQYRGRQPRMNDDHVARVFTRLMLWGRVREAVCFVTDQASGGVLQPNDIDTKLGKCVLDVLREKHPPPGVANHDVFLTCSKLPLLIDVDITPSHVEWVARRLRGSGGPGGTDSYH